MESLSVTIISVFLLAVYYYLEQSKNNTVNVNNNYIPKNINPYLRDIKQKFSNKINSVILQYNAVVSVDMVVSLIFNELPQKDFNKPNNQVIGDGGNSIGYMQVSKPALIDVNNYYKLSFTFNDLYNEQINFIVGTLYFNLCYKSALKDNSINPVYLAYKKYNGGIDETDKSQNFMASTYADKAFNNYKTLV